ncbi:hypothetical protein [Methylovulum psychrotolerans]|uniref:Uncharacterized protein n=1 Tax=Methylovulum psychrotolerans TaxID=1704499 RepID=A0A1Z4C323_9GAMM|nr:hypothetical protein [Methylovulum psychrotolerans]ASF47905.1 hypothetical protein CEK71_18555 [Methylovulum psychrotolerans]
MAFANEYLTDEQERKKYGSAYVTIDRERDAWLTRSGGGGEMPKFVELHWKNEEIKMHAYDQAKKNAEGTYDIAWRVAKMRIPEKLERYRQDILEMVREALIRHKDRGCIKWDQQIKTVHVEFNDRIINYNPGDIIWM